MKIAVFAPDMPSFEHHVRKIYEGLPDPKRLTTLRLRGGGFEIEHPIGAKTEYIRVREKSDMDGRDFKEVQRTDDFLFQGN